MGRRQKKVEVSAGATSAREDLQLRFVDLLEQSAVEHMRRRQSNTLTESDFNTAWRKLFGASSVPVWRLAVSDLAMFLAGGVLAYGTTLLSQPPRLAGVVLMATAVVIVGLAVCLKYFKT